MEHLIYVETVTAAYLLWMAVIMQVKNTRSSLIFKTLPLIMSVGLALDVLFRSGWMIRLPS